jgi:NAD(P)-dependent dehydrogenase (short-subunit alcohol dehydrogenase family)
MSSYTAAKHAMRGFVDALRIELRTEGLPVSLTLIEPGPVDTPFWGHVASHTGRVPPVLPLSYHPDEVAVAIQRGIDSRAPRLTVGGAMVALRTVHRFARPLTERVMARAATLAGDVGEEGAGAAAIWNPSGTGEVTAAGRTRPSALVRGRQLASAAWSFPARLRG